MIATFDLGGTDIKYGVIDDQEKLIYQDIMPSTAKSGGKKLLDSVIDLVAHLQTLYAIDGIAISSAGVINPETGMVLSATDAIPNYTGINVIDYIEGKTKLNTSVINDVKAAALSEAKYIDEKSVLMLTIGTGIGGAILYDHNIYHGHHYSAGEWGHMYIAGKAFEKLASMSALLKEAKDKKLDVNTGEDLFKLFDQDHLIAVSVVQKFYHYLSMGIANLVYSFNPEVIIIGGGVSNRGQKMIEELKQALHSHLPKFYINSVNIICAKNLNHAGMLGAYIHYKNMKGL
jgi:predicted NBD/HSP70 family sugar kinase